MELEDEDVCYFILTRECMAEKKVKSSLFSKQRESEEVMALSGSLWFLKKETFANMSRGQGKRSVTFKSAEQPGHVLHLEKLQDIIKLRTIEYRLLLAVTTCKDRIAVYRTEGGSVLREACDLVQRWSNNKSQQPTVNVADEKGLQEQVTGRVVYAGSISGRTGCWFAVEFTMKYSGDLPLTDGIFDGKVLFTCQCDRTVLVAVNKLCSNMAVARSVQPSSSRVPPIDAGKPQLEIGERVVWISPEDKSELGVVRWIGQLSDRPDEYTIGVEFDNPIGSGTGTYRGDVLFATPPKHASLIPPNGLLKAVDFYGDASLVPPPPSQHFAFSDNTTAMLPSFNTNNMNSNFIWREQLLREQEMALTPFSNRRMVETADSCSQEVGGINRTASRNTQLSTCAAELRSKGILTNSMDFTLDTSHIVDATDIFKDDEVNSRQPVDKEASSTDVRNVAGGFGDAVGSSRPAAAAMTGADHQEVEAQTGSFVKPLSAVELGTDLEIGCMVEVTVPGSSLPQYGVIRWMGMLRDRDKPFVGIEMEEETVAGTDGTFGHDRMFTCTPKHAFFTYLHRVKRDTRFVECSFLVQRTNSHAFGSLDCPDVTGSLSPWCFDNIDNIGCILGRNKGIQGHQNSCYMDATLFSMFAFSMAFDTLLYRPRRPNDIDKYSQVQQVLRDGIVNPLRSETMFVRADKVMELRKLLNECSSVAGLVSEEKDPEEFLHSLLQQTLKADSFLKLSSGQECYFYQLFLEKDEMVSLPTTQHLLGLSFYQSDLKLVEVPSCLILQMPRFGKDFKMYRRIVPSLTLDVTDLLLHDPRPCFNCGHVAELECKDCYKDVSGGGGTEKQFFCRDCHTTYHKHPKRTNHSRPRQLQTNPDFLNHVKDSGIVDQDAMPRETMDLFAVICIRTSHYVAFVKCGMSVDSPWIFFDSMADRIGQAHGYNIPNVELCPELPSYLKNENQAEILKMGSDKDLPEQMRRLLCDGYICMYQNANLVHYR